MKVCHLTSVHPALDTRIFYKECKSLADAGWDVTLIARRETDEVVDGIKIIRFYEFKTRWKRIFLSPLKMFTIARKQKADIYHFHDPELLITGILLRFFTRSNVIYDIHEEYEVTIIDRRWIKFKIVRFIISKIFRYFELLVCRVMSANVVVLPDWLNKYPKATLVRNFPFLEKIKEKKDENLFVYVGVICEERSAKEMILIFIELMKMIPDITFNIIGLFWEKDIEAEVMGHVNSHPNITFLGFLPFPEAKKILAKTKYGFVLYSTTIYQKYVSVKMYEYLANDVIPIYSSFKDLEHEIEKEGWGIGVNPKNPREAAQKIRDIITNREKIKTIKENMKKYREKYNWASEKRELLNLYKHLIKKSNK